MDDKGRKELDLEKEHPFPRYQPQDEWMKHRKPIDDDKEGTGWGE